MICGGVTAITNVLIRWVSIGRHSRPRLHGSRWTRVDEFATPGLRRAGLLRGAEVDVFTKRQSLRHDVQAIMDQRKFHPDFQLFVDLKSGRVVGHEALTEIRCGEWSEHRLMQAHGM